MNTVVKHIGLQVKESDIASFYVDILGFEAKREFSLAEDVSNEIFGIKKDVKIIYGVCGSAEIELFVNDAKQVKSYAHVCIQVDDAVKMSKRANEKGYRVYTRGKAGSETFFISDSNGNIFEVKPLIINK